MVLSNVRIPFAPPLPAQQEQREVYANVLAGLEVAVPNIGDRIVRLHFSVYLLLISIVSCNRLRIRHCMTL